MPLSTTMTPISPRTWKLLTWKLRQSDRASISLAELQRAGGDLEQLQAGGLVQRLDVDLLQAPGCEDSCSPNWDWDSRKREGLVGVACPNEPACWSGFKWLRRADLEDNRVDVRGVLGALQARSGLVELAAAIPRPFLAVGRTEKRGKTLSVIWARRLNGALEPAALGLLPRIGGDWLLVVVSGESGPPRLLAPAVAVLGLAVSSEGALELDPALDVLDPGYRERAVADPEIDLEFVRLGFATNPTERRHLLRINDQEVGTFQQSDVGFLRLLVLAASRRPERSEGWRLRSVLMGDFASRPAPASLKKAGDALDSLRDALRLASVPGLTEEELGAVVKTQAGSTGKIRLAVPPQNVVFDPSLEFFEWAGPGATARSDGMPAKLTPQQRKGLLTAQLLLAECRRLGVPGDPKNIPPVH